MILKQKSLEKLRDLINEETTYRSGPNLVNFFNQLGANDTYGQGFPSRWKYTDEKLQNINGTPELDSCIKTVLDPINFIEDVEVLDKLIGDFNRYLAFDKWKVVRKNDEICFEKADKVVIKPSEPSIDEEDAFLERDFGDVSIDALGLETAVTDTLQQRINEIQICLSKKAPLAAIFLCGSTLEGILLGIALKEPKKFNQASSAPKDKEGKVKNFPDWNLSNFIDSAHVVGLLKQDVKKYSHSLRDFRNYIHPYHQMASQFEPDTHTAKLSWQVLKLAIIQLTKKA